MKEGMRNVTIDPEKIKLAIRRSGINQKELSLAIGYSDSYVSTSLAQKSMNGKALVKLAAILGCYPEQFVTDEVARGSDQEDADRDIDRVCNLLAAIYKKLSVIDSNLVSLGKSLCEEESEPTDEVDQLVKKLFGGAA